MPFGNYGNASTAAEDFVLGQKNNAQKALAKNLLVKSIQRQEKANRKNNISAAKSMRERGLLTNNDPNRARNLANAEFGATYDAKQGRMHFGKDPNETYLSDIVSQAKDNPRLFAEVVAMSGVQDYIKSTAPTAITGLSGGIIPLGVAKDLSNQYLNKPIMQTTLENAPISQQAKDALRSEWVAPATATTFIQPAMTAASLATGGVSSAFPITTAAVKATAKVGKVVGTAAKVDKVGKAALDIAGLPAGLMLGVGGAGGNIVRTARKVNEAKAAVEAAKSPEQTLADNIQGVLDAHPYDPLVDLGPVERPSAPWEISDPSVVEKDISKQRTSTETIYKDVSNLFDPSHPFSYDAFIAKYPDGKITLSRLDAENLIDNKALGFFDPAGAYSGPKTKVSGEKSLHDQVTIQIKPRTEDEQKTSLLKHGQPSNKRQKVINTALDKFYSRTGITDPRKSIRDRQRASFTSDELTRIWGENGNYKVVEPANSGHPAGWSRVDHGDHLIARKRIENRVVDLANGKIAKAGAQKVADTIAAYVEFQNSADNFMGLHGMRNINKSDMESNDWIKIASTPYEEIPPKFKPYKAEIDKAYAKLKEKVGEEEFNIFMSQY